MTADDIDDGSISARLRQWAPCAIWRPSAPSRVSLVALSQSIYSCFTAKAAFKRATIRAPVRISVYAESIIIADAEVYLLRHLFT